MVAFDLYSKWPELAIAEILTTKVVTTALEEWFSKWRLPLKIITTNIHPQFISKEFKTFLKNSKKVRCIEVSKIPYEWENIKISTGSAVPVNLWKQVESSKINNNLLQIRTIRCHKTKYHKPWQENVPMRHCDSQLQ